MATQTHLTTAKINQAKPKAKAYKLSAGGGIFLLVHPNGSKYWRLKYRLNGKEGVFSIGVHPDVSYADAIKAKQYVKALLKEGKDPNQAKRDAKKLSPKPVNHKSTFRMEMSSAGGIVIETDTKLVQLTPKQTDALKAFLIATITDTATRTK